MHVLCILETLYELVKDHRIAALCQECAPDHGDGQAQVPHSTDRTTNEYNDHPTEIHGRTCDI